MGADDTTFRKLAAIMFTDMVGYSALTQRNETLALQLLEEQRQFVGPVFITHQGREVKSTGDGYLVVFPSALAATQCAIEIQKAMEQRNRVCPPERRFQIRIGIHAGDVEFREADLFGDCVNIAARIEPLAEPGGIALSRAVVEQIKQKIASRLIPIEDARLKNIQTPVEVFRVVLPRDDQRAPTVEPNTAIPAKNRQATGLVAGLGISVVVLAVALALKFHGTQQGPVSSRRETNSIINQASRPSTGPQADQRDSRTLVDEGFDNLDEHGFPKGWEVTLVPGCNISTKEYKAKRFLVLDSSRRDETVSLVRTVKVDPKWNKLRVKNRLKTEQLFAGPGGGGAIINLVWKDTPVNQIQWLGAGGVVQKPGAAPDSDWTSFETDYPIPVEATHVMLVISLRQASGSMSFSDLNVTAVDEGARESSLGTSLFNQTDFTGWTIYKEQQQHWSVTNGAILCDTKGDKPVSTGLWRKEQFGDFELRFTCKFTGALEPGKHSLNLVYRIRDDDHQYHLQLGTNGIGLIDKRGPLAVLGDRTVWKTGQTQRQLLGRFGRDEELAAAFHKEDWNEIVVRVKGNHHLITMNWLTLIDFTDEDSANGSDKGEFGIVVWNAEKPFAVAQLKNIRITRL